MRIDGKALANTILNGLKHEADLLKQGGTLPTLAVILIGDNPASLAYIKQKGKAAEHIGARLIFEHQPSSLTSGGLYNLINQFNKDPNVHGLIVQRPIPKEVGGVTGILSKIHPQKDVDGFLPDSPFDVPVALAVGELLASVYRERNPINRTDELEVLFWDWMRSQSIAVVGRGETAGAPILRYLKDKHCTTSEIHSQTPNPEKILKQSDIVISCVGMERVVRRESVKPGAILISVGIWRNEQGKLRGDYEEEDITDVASYYTPTPGGVGPVNVACLMKNLIKASMIKGKE